MTDAFLYIFNIISILFLLASVGYLSHICEEQGVGFIKLSKALVNKNWHYFRSNKVYVLCYLWMTVILGIGLIQISQLNIGMPRIKTDWAFVVGIVFWVFLFFIIKGFHDKTKKNEPHS